MITTLTEAQITALPAVLDVPTAARVLGLSRTAAYELIRTGDWPTPVFRLGRLIRIPTAPILDLLGIDPTTRAVPRDTPSTDRHQEAG